MKKPTMNSFCRVASVLLATSWVGAASAQTGVVVAEVTQLSGFVMAVKPNAALRLLSLRSGIEAGDSLLSEANTYVRIHLADGREAVLGPQTRLVVSSASAMSLTSGQLQVFTSARPGAGVLRIEAGGNTVEASSASFTMVYRPVPAPTLAQRAYSQASMAMAGSGVVSDAGSTFPLWEPLAQNTVVPPKTLSATPSLGLPPGLHVYVIDGLISVRNTGGSSQFQAGQFGYTPNFAQPPVLVPSNPAIRFLPPPTFAPSNPGKGSTGSSPSAVDCEVR